MKQFSEVTEELMLEIATCPSFDIMPLGQKLLKLGIKPTEDKDLREWFKCDEIEKRAQAAEKARREEESRIFEEERKRVREARLQAEALERTKKASGIEIKERVDHLGTSIFNRVKGYHDNSWFDEAKAIPKIDWGSSFILSRLDTQREFNRREAERMLMGSWWGDTIKKCVVTYEPLDSYMRDTIPDYVLEHLQTAKDFGFDKFEVAYPEIKDERLPDPVLLGLVGDKKFFISFWE